jgi:hypothetical protein
VFPHRAPLRLPRKRYFEVKETTAANWADLRLRRRLILSLYRELFPMARAFDPKRLTLRLLKHTG